MTQDKLLQLTGKVFQIIKDLSPAERQRVIQAAFALFGEPAPSPTTPDHQQPIDSSAGGGNINAKQFFSLKDPQTKGEELAVAARWLEKQKKQDAYTKKDLKTVINDDARRNFDSANFAQDMRNAKRQTGLFKMGGGRKHSLSYYGQNYVDKLPDREAIKKLRKPKDKRLASKSKSRKKKN